MPPRQHFLGDPRAYCRAAAHELGWIGAKVPLECRTVDRRRRFVEGDEYVVRGLRRRGFRGSTTLLAQADAIADFWANIDGDR